MSKVPPQTYSFHQSGELLGCVIKDGSKLKYLRMVISQQECWIKVPKKLRQQLSELVPGCSLEIIGNSKLNSKTGKLKITAESVRLIDNIQITNTPLIVSSSPNVKNDKTKHSILICQKSDCWKQKGKDLSEAIESFLSDRGLTEQVEIKRTGCLKKCNKGPNLIIMPNKTYYHQVKPQDIPTLLEKHLASNTGF